MLTRTRLLELLHLQSLRGSSESSECKLLKQILEEGGGPIERALAVGEVMADAFEEVVVEKMIRCFCYLLLLCCLLGLDV